MGAAVLLAATAAVADAQTASTFPFEAWNAKAAALGGAGTAASGVEFAPLNPAALAGVSGAQISRHVGASDAEDIHADVATRTRFGTVAVSFRRRDWGRVAEELGLDDLTAGEQALGIAYAVAPGVGRVSAGAAVSRVDTDYLGAKSGGWSVDAGARLALRRDLHVGGSLLHSGRMTDDADEPTKLPTQLRAGGGWTPKFGLVDALLLADVALPTGGEGSDVHAGVGASADVGAVRVSTRAGWRSLGNPYGDDSSERSWSFGGGAGFGPIEVDLAHATGGTLGGETFLSLSIRW